MPKTSPNSSSYKGLFCILSTRFINSPSWLGTKTIITFKMVPVASSLGAIHTNYQTKICNSINAKVSHFLECGGKLKLQNPTLLPILQHAANSTNLDNRLSRHILHHLQSLTSSSELTPRPLTMQNVPGEARIPNSYDETTSLKGN